MYYIIPLFDAKTEVTEALKIEALNRNLFIYLLKKPKQFTLRRQAIK